MRAPLPLLTILLAAAPAVFPQRTGKETARELFYSEAGLIVSSRDRGKGKFSGAKKSVLAVTLGLKYRVWKMQDEKPVDADTNGPWTPGDTIRLGIEVNDGGYLYLVHRQPTGRWRRLFPTPDIDRGSHFVRGGVIYSIPPEEGLPLLFQSGPERVLVVLAREPLRDLETLVGPLAAENTVSAAPPPEISDAVVEKIRTALNPKDLVTEGRAGEKTVYAVNRSGRPDSVVVLEIRFTAR
jgi:hypothetical protein